MPNCNALATDENVFFNHQLFLEQGTKQKQKSYQHTRRDAQTKPIVSPVMRFRAAGDRLCRDRDWQHLKMAPRLLSLPCFMVKKPTNWGKWLYLIRKYIPLASSPPGGIIII